MEKKILENLFKIGGNVLEGWRSFYSSKKFKLLKSKLKDRKNTTFEQIEKVKTICFFLFLQIQMLAVWRKMVCYLKLTSLERQFERRIYKDMCHER